MNCRLNALSKQETALATVCRLVPYLTPSKMVASAGYSAKKPDCRNPGARST
jgi:hypothetical protein